MSKGTAARKYITQKWFKIIGSIAAATVGVAVLAQFGFGKIRNPQNVEKKDNHVTNA